MPRAPKPTEVVIRETLSLAILLGKDNYADIQRSLEQRLEVLRREQGISPGNTPDTRTIKWIVNEYINQLPAEAVIAEFPPHLWVLRRDYKKLNKQKRERDSLIIEAGEKHVLEAPHNEDVRGAIRDWLAFIKEPPPVFNPAAAGEPMHFGFGLTWQAEPEGIAAKLIIEKEGSYPLLSSHLAPPIVAGDFWGQVESLRDTGTNLLVRGSQLGKQIAKVSQAETDLATVTSWQRVPNVGITTEFGATISRNALRVEQCTSYAYFELAIIYLEGGIMITQVGEGMRLLQGAGLDPTLTTAYVSTAGAWVIPQANQRLICDEAVGVSEAAVRAIHFVLHLHGYVIAIGSLGQIRHCRDVHRWLMRKYAGWPDTMAVLELREKLESTSKAISAQLEKASLHHYFPGRCSFCPSSEGDIPLAESKVSLTQE